MTDYTISTYIPEGTKRLDGATITITGKDIVAAVEDNFDKIRSFGNIIGNVAGYTLDRVYIDAPTHPTLRVVYHGSDGLVNYDPITDQPREVKLSIAGMPEDEAAKLPIEIELESTRENGYDIFAEDPTPEDAYGTALAIIDHLGHACIGEGSEDITAQVGTAAPGMATSNPQKFFAACMGRLQQRHIKQTAANSCLQERLAELVTIVLANPDHKYNGYESIVYYRALGTLYRAGKITALAYYRKKANKLQQEVADQVGISLRQLQNYEKANSSLGDAKYYVVEKIAQAVGVQPAQIVKGHVAVMVDANT